MKNKKNSCSICAAWDSGAFDPQQCLNCSESSIALDISEFVRWRYNYPELALLSNPYFSIIDAVDDFARWFIHEHCVPIHSKLKSYSGGICAHIFKESDGVVYHTIAGDVDENIIEDNSLEALFSRHTAKQWTEDELCLLESLFNGSGLVGDNFILHRVFMGHLDHDLRIATGNPGACIVCLDEQYGIFLSKP